MINSKYAKIASASALGLALIVGGASAAKAASNTIQINPMTNLIKSISTKFNLNEADVQKVFDENRSQIETQMKEQFKKRLQTAVTNGKLTQVQADLIIAKTNELEAFKSSLQGKTQDEIKTALDSQKTAIDKWLSDNKIPKEYFQMMGKGGKMGKHSGFRPGQNPQINPQTQK